MRILIATPYLPSPGADGGGTVMFNLIKNLSSHHKITCLSFAGSRDMPQLAQLQQFCTEVITVPFPGAAGGGGFCQTPKPCAPSTT